MPTLGAKDQDSCAVSGYGQVFTDPREKFFFSLVTSACDRHRSVQLQARNKTCGTQGKQLAETGQGRLALKSNKRFEISPFISFHVEQFISSTQEDKFNFCLRSLLVLLCFILFLYSTEMFSVSAIVAIITGSQMPAECDIKSGTGLALIGHAYMSLPVQDAHQCYEKCKSDEPKCRSLLVPYLYILKADIEVTTNSHVSVVDQEIKSPSSTNS